jgi:hypothetical protein
MRTTRVAVPLLLTWTMAACGTDPLGSSRVDGGVETDSTSYHVLTTDSWHEVTIGVSFRNPTFNEVLIPTCHAPHPPVLEKLGQNGWVTAYSPTVLDCLGPPVRIAPGEAYSMTYRVIGARLPNSAPRFDVDEIAGTYRLNWHALRTKSGSRLPSAYRTSSPFQLLE